MDPAATMAAIEREPTRAGLGGTDERDADNDRVPRAAAGLASHDVLEATEQVVVGNLERRAREFFLLDAIVDDQCDVEHSLGSALDHDHL
jgi:hypothetical protein